jgi:hypothetical protein
LGYQSGSAFGALGKRPDVAVLHLGAILPNYDATLDGSGWQASRWPPKGRFRLQWVTDHLIVPPEDAGTYGTIAGALVSLAS